MSGWDMADYFTHFDTFNTVTYFPGKSGKGDAFRMSEARPAAAKHVSEKTLGERTCLFVGKANASCYPWPGGKLPEPFDLVGHEGGGHWAWFPHTSGIVQFWNQGDNKVKLRQLFDEVSQIILL